jgi:hypothetical protein
MALIPIELAADRKVPIEISYGYYYLTNHPVHYCVK